MNSQEQKDLPLVSIVVLTYNSSKYVLETLDSAYNQTYEGPLELIISDDCSTDDTVEICKNWISEWGTRFHRVEMMAATQNVGVSRNINVGCRAACGSWIKPIAGDDALLPECIETMVGYHLDAPLLKVFSSPVYAVKRLGKLNTEDQEYEVMMPVAPGTNVDIKFALMNDGFFLPAPGFFYSKELLENVDYFPIDCKNIEDAPMMWKIFSAGYIIPVLKSPLVWYRVSGDSLTSSIDKSMRCLLAKLRCRYLWKNLNNLAKCELVLQTWIRIINLKETSHVFDKLLLRLLFRFMLWFRKYFESYYFATKTN